MKKVICSFIILMISLSIYGFADAKSSSGTLKNSFSVSVFINGKKIPGTHPGTLVNSQYLISSTPIFKALGGQVSWNSSTNRISIKLKDKRFALYNNKKVVYVGNKRIALTTSPRVINGKTMMSANLLEKISGAKVIFDKKTKQVRITVSDKAGANSSNSKTSSKLSGKTVVIDPGHGGNTDGAKYGGLKEKDLNLDVSLRLYSLLKSKGIKAYLTRKTDSTLTLAQRYNYANSVKAALFVSVHHNALPNNLSYKGTETLYSPSGATLKGISSKNLAKIAQTELVRKLGTINRGIISRPELAVLRHSKMPSIIAEIGYMSNSKERQRINNSSFKQKSAEALCSAIIETLNQMK